MTMEIDALYAGLPMRPLDPPEWIETARQLPPEETPVLLVRNGRVVIGERRWEHPTYEETFRSFWFWACVDDNWHDDEGEASVSHWMPLPELPRAQSTPQPPAAPADRP